MLISQLFGCTRDSTRAVPQTVFVSTGGSQTIAHSFYKRDSISAVHDIYMLFNEQFNTKRFDKYPLDN